MLRSLALLIPLMVAPEIGSAPADREVVRTLDRWRKAFKAGRISLQQRIDTDEDNRQIYHKDALPEPLPQNTTHEGALEILLESAVESADVDAARAMIEIAALGLGEAIPIENPPFRIRDIALRALRRCQDKAVLVFLSDTARGERTAWSAGWREENRAAAIRALGAPENRTFRILIEQTLLEDDRLLRLAAVESLQEAGWHQALPALTAALRRESDPTVARSIVIAAHSILRRQHGHADVRAVRDTVSGAIDKLGHTDWRAELAIVELLMEFRSVLAIEPLIGVLRRFADATEIGPRTELSPILLHTAHRALTELTGALFPADAPAAWQQFWSESRDGFRLAPPANTMAPRGRTQVSEFFGIPVEGARIVFVIDLSGSMAMHDAAGAAGVVSRLDAAKEQLLAAVDRLPEDASFNVVFFSTGVTKWRNDFGRATKSLKAALARHLARIDVMDSTNLFGGLQAALDIRSHVYGQRYETQADEVFLLSDGAPTIGQVTEPGRILEIVTEGNRYSGVRINTISMGDGSHKSFMQQLARQNGGRHVAF